LFLDLLILASGLLAVLAGAKTFTNGVEWAGKKLHLSEGALGSVLAAVGTALPETMVPLIAILFGPPGTAHDVGIGAILGAPFMLSTLAFGVVGVSKLVCCRGENGRCIEVKRSIFTRDLRYFIVFYTLAVLTAFAPWRPAKIAVAAFLMAGYAFYVKKTLGDGDSLGEADLEPLYFWRKEGQPPLYAVVGQAFIGLVLIAAGAHYFVDGLSLLAETVMVPALILSLILTPVATELPEKFNSIIWVKGGKDTLAVGNITGAMVFQSSVIPALGMLFTPWNLTFLAALSAGLALLSGLTVYLFTVRQKALKTSTMLYPVLIYGVFLVTVFAVF